MKDTAEKDPDDLAEHLLDFYGQCVVEPCDCNRAQWLGRRCPNWRPNGATTTEELMARARRLHQEKKATRR